MWRVLFPWSLFHSICHLFIRRLLIFLELILCPATLWKVIPSYRSSLEEILWSLMHAIISYSNNSTYFLLPIFPLISCCLIALDKTPNTIFNRYEKSRQHCHVPDFWKVVLSLSPLNFCLLKSCCKQPLRCLCMSFIFLISPGLFSWNGVEFCQKTFWCLMRWSCGFRVFVFLSVYLNGRLHLLIAVCWNIPALLRLSLFDNDIWYFWCLLGFDLQLFYWIFCLHVHKEIWSIILCVCWVFMWYGIRIPVAL